MVAPAEVYKVLQLQRQILFAIMRSIILFTIVIISISTRCNDAFLAPLHINNKRANSYLNARSICTFDEDDFALKQGEWPYSTSDLNRLDNTIDTEFYNEPRFVTHIDDGAIASLTKYYQEEFSNAMKNKDSLDVLDLCSSWISHLPQEGPEIKYGNVVGVGMNEKELQANQQLTNYVVQDLNENPILNQFEDNSFDFICNVVSVDYLTKPVSE